MKILLTGIFIATALHSFSQSSSLPNQLITKSPNWSSLSCPEKWWVITHLFVAKKAKAISQEAREASKQMEKDSTLDGDADGGQVDAFRHSYWMARLAQEMSWKKALKLGDAHEKGNYRKFKRQQYEEKTISDSAGSSMDTFNNRVGVSIGCNNKSLTRDQLVMLLKQKIIGGQMRVIRKDNQKRSLDCNGNTLELPAYKGIWNTPRCIVASDKVPPH